MFFHCLTCKQDSTSYLFQGHENTSVVFVNNTDSYSELNTFVSWYHSLYLLDGTTVAHCTLSNSLMETCHWQIDHPITFSLSALRWDQFSKWLQYFNWNKEQPVRCACAECLLMHLQSDVKGIWQTAQLPAGVSAVSKLEPLQSWQQELCC